MREVYADFGDRLGNMRASGSCSRHGGYEYIFERIILRHSDPFVYEGALCFPDISPCLSSQLSLCSVNCIRTEKADAGNVCSMQKTSGGLFHLMLLCTVADQYGRREERIAEIDARCNMCGSSPWIKPDENERFRVCLRILHAHPLNAVSFHVRLEGCIETIVSRFEIIGEHPKCSAIPARNIPLYPPACHCEERNRCCK